MEQSADRHALPELVEALHGGFGLQDLDLDAVLGQDVQGFGTDLKPFPDTSRKHHGFGASIDQLLNVAGLNAGHMARTGLAPVPFPRATGKDLGILEGRVAVDLDMSP